MTKWLKRHTALGCRACGGGGFTFDARIWTCQHCYAWGWDWLWLNDLGRWIYVRGTFEPLRRPVRRCSYCDRVDRILWWSVDNCGPECPPF